MRLKSHYKPFFLAPLKKSAFGWLCHARCSCRRDSVLYESSCLFSTCPAPKKAVENWTPFFGKCASDALGMLRLWACCLTRPQIWKTITVKIQARNILNYPEALLCLESWKKKYWSASAVGGARCVTEVCFKDPGMSGGVIKRGIKQIWQINQAKSQPLPSPSWGLFVL